MRTLSGLAAVALAGPCFLQSLIAGGQTPEQEKVWEAQQAQTLVDQRAKAERLAKERAARKADPMAWVRTLDPMSAGGWEFRNVADDGSWAAYSTDHQLKHKGKTVTVWLRQEYAEPHQDSGSDAYRSTVENVQYDCAKERARTLLVIYYSENNIKGNEQSVQADPKASPWDPIVPGTLSELNFRWACGTDKDKAGR
jgi:hypothetical protein